MKYLSRRAARALPAYHRGELSPRQRQRLEARLAADPALRREHEDILAVGEMLRRGDPATPVEPAATRALQAELRPLLPPPLRLPRYARPQFALGAALLLFGAGLLTGGQLFGHTEIREVVRERTVAVAVPVASPVPVRVEVPVVKRVEVPVTKVVTRWRTRTVVQTRVVYRGRPAAPAVRTVRQPEATRPGAVPVVDLNAATVRPAVGVATLPEGVRPATVEF